MQPRALGVLVLLSIGVSRSPAAAQQQRVTDAPPRTTLRGVVVDALHGDPLPNAMIRLVDAHRGVLTDSLGRFVIAGVPLGADVMAVKQYGYEEIDAEVVLRENHPTLRIELQPGPVALEGFEVVADRLAVMKQRLQDRRNATATAVRTFDQEELNRTAARDMLDFLAISGGVRPADCASRGPTSFGNAGPAALGWSSGSCVERRGGVLAPRVYIDEAWAIGGLDELGTYKPYELFAVEVYGGGGEIRAYTHNFMDRMAGRTMALIPIGLWFGR